MLSVNTDDFTLYFIYFQLWGRDLYKIQYVKQKQQHKHTLKIDVVFILNP